MSAVIRTSSGQSALLPSTHTASYLPAWDSNLNAYVDVAPTGASELASASNNTGTAFPAPATSTDVPGLSISVAASGGRPVWLAVFAACQQTTTGAGVGLLAVYDTTGGGSVFLGNIFNTLPNSIGTYSKFFTIQGQLPVGVLATAKTYKVQAQCLVDTASSAAFSLLNGGSASTPSYLSAQAR